MTYLPFVDGLRAVAILSVVIFHALQWALPGGFAGVDVFFVISGFLITRFIVSEIDANEFSLGRFYVRRARRLLPAALVCFSTVTLSSAFILLPDALWYHGRSLVAAVLMYANVFFYDTGGYFTAPDLEKPLLHTWSLAVEDQFYLTWPLILFALAASIPRRALVALAGAGLLASLAFAEVKVKTDVEYAFFLLPTRAWELLVGALLALGLVPKALPRGVANAVAGIGLAAILASFVLLSEHAHFPGLGALPAALGTALVIAASLQQPTVVSAMLSHPSFVFVGLISYSLYLWHWPLLVLTAYQFERRLSVSEAAIVVAVSFVAAYLSWRFVERPFRALPVHDGGKHSPPGASVKPTSWLAGADKRFIASTLVCVLILIGMAGALKIFKGVPQRYHSAARDMLEQMASSNPLRLTCDHFDKIFQNDAACNLGRKKQPAESYEAALFGDSMSDHWAPLLTLYARQNNISARQVTNGGCALLFGVKIPAWPLAKTSECEAYQAEAEKFVLANPGLKVAFISGFWEKWLGRLEHADQRAEVPQPTSLEEAEGAKAVHFDAALDSTIKVFRDRGATVVLIGQIPVYNPLPMLCLVKAVQARGPDTSCAMKREAAMAQLKRSDEALKRAAKRHSGVSVVLPSEYICQQTHCSTYLDGIFLYKNGGHLNQYGAEILHKYARFPLPH